MSAQLAMFGAAPAIACPACGAARKVYADGIDDLAAARRAYVCDSCGASWSVDGAQLDLLGDADDAQAPTMPATALDTPPRAIAQLDLFAAVDAPPAGAQHPADAAYAQVADLYDAARYIDGGATLPADERQALWKRAADIERRAYATPRLLPKKREPETYCFRCGEPVYGGLFCGNSSHKGRRFSWVNADHDPATPCDHGPWSSAKTPAFSRRPDAAPLAASLEDSSR